MVSPVFILLAENVPAGQGMGPAAPSGHTNPGGHMARLVLLATPAPPNEFTDPGAQ